MVLLSSENYSLYFGVLASALVDMGKNLSCFYLIYFLILQNSKCIQVKTKWCPVVPRCTKCY